MNPSSSDVDPLEFKRWSRLEINGFDVTLNMLFDFRKDHYHPYVAFAYASSMSRFPLGVDNGMIVKRVTECEKLSSVSKLSQALFHALDSSNSNFLVFGISQGYVVVL